MKKRQNKQRQSFLRKLRDQNRKEKKYAIYNTLSDRLYG